jgi:hypothetical protein
VVSLRFQGRKSELAFIPEWFTCDAILCSEAAFEALVDGVAERGGGGLTSAE